MTRAVTVLGATGLVGRHLVPSLRSVGWEVRACSRHARQDPSLGVVEAWQPGDPLPEGRPVINLAGANLAGKRWTADYWQQIVDSRVAWGEGVAAAANTAGVPAVLHASAVGIYGDRREPASEDAPAGEDPLARLCVDWERVYEPVHGRGVALRFGIVLDGADGALPKMLPPLRMPLSPLGDGSQPMPWVHVADVVSVIRAALEDEEMQGALNVVAPERVDNRTFLRQLARTDRRWWLPIGVPGPALRLALGDMARLLLTGQAVVPARLQERNFVWRHGALPDALRACLDQRDR